MRRSRHLSALWILGAIAFAGAQATAQVWHASGRPLAAHIVVPQSGAFAAGRAGQVKITDVQVGVVIVERVATTVMDIGLENMGYNRQEAELIVPVPDGVVVRGFDFQGKAGEPTAEVLTREEAKRTYDAIVAKVRDPALLEFVGYNLIRSSVFPVESRGVQKVRLTYEHVLPADGNRIDYVLPRSEALDYAAPWKVSVTIKSRTPISTVYSPSHRIVTARSSENQVSARVTDDATKEPGAFRLSCLLEGEGVTASLLAYPDPSVGGGYFLLLAGLPAKMPRGDKAAAIRREVTLVFDRSGSMAGEKLDQVRNAALQVLEGLNDGEAFNIIAYSDSIDPFSHGPVRKTNRTVSEARTYLETIKARGGTNIHDALLEALRQKPAEGMLPIVLFLTDGLPTIGQTSERAIREAAAKANVHERRIFTFGVGVDVNTPLLEKIAVESRAMATFVLPKEDVEVRVAQVFKRLAGPVLAGPKLQIVGADGKPSARRVRDVLPAGIPDLFDGDQLVVLGQYLGEKPLTFLLRGNYFGAERTFRFRFDLDKATTRNAFVPRLWASRKIAVLVDAIRQAGADGGAVGPHASAASDPRTRELVEEIVRLSKEFGILTEYTSFLAREGTDLSEKSQVLAQAERNFRERAMNTRSGLGSVSQSLNTQAQRAQSNLNFRNAYYDENLNRVAVSNVQQISDQAFYRRGNRWVDSRIVDQTVTPRATIEFGSDEFHRLTSRLAAEGRQGSVSLRGDVVMVVDGEPVLVKGPANQ
jgi:Ca-activated chloride channel family protein